LQSARLGHYRPAPLDGEYYASLFVHYAPPSWPLTRADIDAQLPSNWDQNTVVERPVVPQAQSATPQTAAEQPAERKAKEEL
jgi:hypothetical protein